MIKVVYKFFRALPSAATALVMVVPIVCVVAFALGVDVKLWSMLWSSRIPSLLMNSSALVVTVCFFTLLLGGSLAYLVERTDLPARRLFKPLLVTPIITPCYIIGICYVNFFGVNGLGERLFASLGCPLTLPAIYGFWGVVFVLSIGTYPYVYTIVGSSLKYLDPRLSESAQILGLNAWQRLWRVALPMLLPAFSAGAILVTLYVLSDFGVVSMLRYRTFVNTIYEQISARYDYSNAAALSLVLIAITVFFVIMQGVAVKKKYYASLHPHAQAQKLRPLGALKAPAVVFIVLVLFSGLVMPVGILVYWVAKSFQYDPALHIWRIPMHELIHSSFNSVLVSALAASAAVCLAIPLTYWYVRKPSSALGKLFFMLAQSGIALPGVLIALGLSVIFSKTIPALNFSVLALFLAFLMHFFGQSLQTMQAGLRQLSPQFEESARTLGCSTLQSFWQVTRPLLSPAMMSAWILVFLSSMRELPASLLLRPAGFDPLTVKIWNAASEGFYEQAAAPALLVVLLSLPLVFVIMKNEGKLETSMETN